MALCNPDLFVCCMKDALEDGKENADPGDQAEGAEEAAAVQSDPTKGCRPTAQQNKKKKKQKKAEHQSRRRSTLRRPRKAVESDDDEQVRYNCRRT